jgi:hypothetical protein
MSDWQLSVQKLSSTVTVCQQWPIHCLQHKPVPKPCIIQDSIAAGTDGSWWQPLLLLLWNQSMLLHNAKEIGPPPQAGGVHCMPFAFGWIHPNVAQPGILRWVTCKTTHSHTHTVVLYTNTQQASCSGQQLNTASTAHDLPCQRLKLP